MARILLLSSIGFLIFAGFGTPFIFSGWRGIVAGLTLIGIGAAVFWQTEIHTAHHLQSDTPWNRLMNADDEELVRRSQLRGDK